MAHDESSFSNTINNNLAQPHPPSTNKQKKELRRLIEMQKTNAVEPSNYEFE